MNKVDEAGLEAAARAVCVLRGVDPDSRPRVSYQSLTGRAQEHSPPPSATVVSRGPARWEMEVPFVRAAIAAYQAKGGEGEPASSIDSWQQRGHGPTPFERMAIAGKKAVQDSGIKSNLAGEVYDAVLAAAPAPEPHGDGVRVEPDGIGVKGAFDPASEAAYFASIWKLSNPQMAKLEAASRSALTSPASGERDAWAGSAPFITSESGGGEYVVHVKVHSMDELHAAHVLVLEAFGAKL